MIMMRYKDGGEVQQGVGLLISILLRYPEVGTVRYYQDQHALQFTFLTSLPCGEVKLDKTLPEALEVFHLLEEEAMTTCSVKMRWEEGIGTITVIRDVETMTLNEVGLIVEMVKRACGEHLFSEPVSLGEEEMQFQEEIISHMLDNLSGSDLTKNVTAVREEGRVLVFNH